jgi:hypothetical protein
MIQKIFAKNFHYHTRIKKSIHQLMLIQLYLKHIYLITHEFVYNYIIL